MPVQFGIDARTEDIAIAFAIDHNNLTLAGTGLDDLDMVYLWDEGLEDLLARLAEGKMKPISISANLLRAVSDLISDPDLSEYPDPSPESFYTNVSFHLPPALARKFKDWWGELPGENDVEKVNALIG